MADSWCMTPGRGQFVTSKAPGMGGPCNDTSYCLGARKALPVNSARTHQPFPVYREGHP